MGGISEYLYISIHPFPFHLILFIYFHHFAAFCVPLPPSFTIFNQWYDDNLLAEMEGTQIAGRTTGSLIEENEHKIVSSRVLCAPNPQTNVIIN